ncbi:hypothetical protein B0H10DRAFT_1953603 [Mycena sp. CBHHK59/15]|nr:hypothetical protein B0H10DRAFT_1953603 [Mycena sp. CBHHK59/15]
MPLIYVRTCVICLATSTEQPDVDSVWWEFSARFCIDCQSSQVLKSIPVQLRRSEPLIKWDYVFPRSPARCSCIAVTALTVANPFLPSQDNGYFYPIVEIQKFMDVYLATESPQERETAVEARRAQTLAITKKIQQHKIKWLSNSSLERRRRERLEPLDCKHAFCTPCEVVDLNASIY